MNTSDAGGASCPATYVVVLTAELLTAQLVGGHNLPCTVACLLVATRVQHDLSNHGIVWHHHGHCPEQGFQVVWQLRAASIARVHGDEDIAGGAQRQLTPLEHEALHLGLDRHLDFQNLLGHH